ncbi:phage DNA packaging protein [Escherichia coli]|nr:phage DNA packaging protein [Escherichia coli]GCJ73553.1 phage DNA packaging protein [Escherichia coli]GCQ68395.1 phage DNA packaging protein [Escherichia coli]GDG61417.1 phage DNA packaging protein [Escherichia coli]GDI46997.1 phage DNA packaging protein [Escherichia coli]
MPPCLFSQGAEMATKEENLNRLRQLAGLLGREADMSGSAADIAQRVSEWEEELAASREDIMHSDESGSDQNYTDDGEPLNNTDAPDDVKAVRVRKCLHVMGYCPETGRPVELTFRGMRVLVPSSLAMAMIQHGTAEYA